LSTAALEASIASNNAEQERLARELHDLEFLVRLLGGDKASYSRGKAIPFTNDDTGDSPGYQEKQTDLGPKQQILIRPPFGKPETRKSAAIPVLCERLWELPCRGGRVAQQPGAG